MIFLACCHAEGIGKDYKTTSIDFARLTLQQRA